MDSMSKNKIGYGIDSDIISNLPGNITDEILVHLPIEEAVRTSVLSSKWRYKWTTIPELVFCDEFYEDSPQTEQDRFINFIDMVLLTHSGLIQKFELSSSFVPSSSKDRWVYFLSNKNIKKFKLICWSEEEYVLPSYFFFARQFHTLKLHGCVLKPPPTFTGYTNLKSLNLSKTTLGNGVLQGLISKCPLLERLKLFSCDGFDHLNICAPNLKYSLLCGNSSDIYFDSAPLLSDLTISMAKNIIDQRLQLFRNSGICPLVMFLSSLPNIKKFKLLHEEDIEFLGACNIPDRLPFTCHHLSRLSLKVKFEYLNQILVVFCLFNSSPNLRKLKIEVCSRSIGRSSTLTSQGFPAVYDLNTIQRCMGCNMDRLEVVKISSYKKWKLDTELKFITFVLANTPMLKMLSFKTYNKVQPLFSLREICSLPRASPNADVTYCHINVMLPQMQK